MQHWKWMLLVCSWFFISCTGTNKNGSECSLPQIHLTIPEGDVQKDVWTKECGIEVFDTDGSVNYRSFHLQVEGRGNSTYSKPKKPYNLKLEKPISLLGMSVRKRWVLLANFFDHSLMRNAFAFEVCRQTSLSSVTPQGRFVELTVNGKKQGIYYLCERVKDMLPKEAMLLEFDVYAYREDPLVFRTERRNLPVSVRSPKKMPIPLLQTTKELINQLESGDEQLIDKVSFADFWIVHELCQNAEPNGPRSCYVHSLPDGRFAAGPVWDFDLAFITVGLDTNNNLRPMRFFEVDSIASTLRRLDENVFYNESAFCYDVLLQRPSFRQLVKERWQILRPDLVRMEHVIDSIDALIGESAIQDQLMWNHLEPARFDTCTTYGSAVGMLKSTYIRRVASLDSMLNIWK